MRWCEVGADLPVALPYLGLQLSIASFPAWDMIIATGNYPNYISPPFSSPPPPPPPATPIDFLIPRVSLSISVSHLCFVSSSSTSWKLSSWKSNQVRWFKLKDLVGRLEMGECYEKRSDPSSFLGLNWNIYKLFTTIKHFNFVSSGIILINWLQLPAFMSSACWNKNT